MNQGTLGQFSGQFLKRLAARTSYLYLFIGHGPIMWGKSPFCEENPRMSYSQQPAPTSHPHQVVIWKWTLSPYISLPVILHGAKMSYLFEAMNNFRFRRKISNCCCFKLLGLGWFVCSHRSLEYKEFIIRRIVRIPMVEGWMAALFD